MVLFFFAGKLDLLTVVPYHKIKPERFRVAARKAVLHLGRLMTTDAMILERASSHLLDNEESTPGT